MPSARIFRIQSKMIGSMFYVPGFRVPGSAQPPAKKTAGQIEKETDT